jgi:Universal stress protein family
VDLVAISFLMSRDGELPEPFEKLNNFGVPNLGLIVATVIPAILVLAIKDVAGLADLYAVGVVGAIATNLGASSTDKKLNLQRWERILMFCTFLIMAAIEVSLFIDKPNARLFAATILVFGLILRGLVTERAQKKAVSAGLANDARKAEVALSFNAPMSETSGPAMLCAVRGIGRTLDFALQEARETHRTLYLLFVREQPILAPEDRRRKWIDDKAANAIFSYARGKAKGGQTMLPCYAVSDSAADTIVEITATVGASYLILGEPERNMLVKLLRGSIIRNISRLLPEEIHLLVYA